MWGEKILCGNLAELIFNGAHWNLSGRIQTSHKYFNEAVQLILCCKFNEIEGFSAQFLRDAGNPAEIFQRARMKNFNEKIFFFSGQKVKKQRRTDDKMAEIRPKNEKNRKKKNGEISAGIIKFQWSLSGAPQKSFDFLQENWWGEIKKSWLKNFLRDLFLAKKILFIVGVGESLEVKVKFWQKKFCSY